MTDTQLQLGFDTPGLSAVSRMKPGTRPKSPRVPASKPGPIADAKDMAAALASHPDYRVLRRLIPIFHFDRKPLGPLVRVLLLDTETTGLDQSRDKIIELALLQVDLDTVTGLPVGDVTAYDGLEDPGMPISREIEAITGISTAMVRGQHLDETRIAALLKEVDLVIAHNAGFDRPFCEARIPAFATMPWGCSYADIDWKKEGHGSAKLEYLALDKGWFYDAHRAEVDCHALLAVLSEQLPKSGQSGLAKIIAASSRPSYCLQASNAPFEAKDLLKARAYRWNAEQKVWYTRLASELLLMTEYEWLKSAVYGNRQAQVRVEKLDAVVKYSNRAGEWSNLQI